MHALIVGSAAAPDPSGFYRGLLQSAELVIGADGGGVFAALLGRVPDVAVGDFDSSSAEAVATLRESGARLIVHPVMKDETDLDLALQVARDEGAERITLTAAFSDRVDHTLAAFGTLMRAADMRAEVREPSFAAWVVSSKHPLALELPAGSLLSLLAPAGASGVSLEGVRYPLSLARLEPMSSLGVSNVVEAPVVRVTVADGVLVVIAPGSALPPKG